MHLFLKHCLLRLPGKQFVVMILFCTLLAGTTVAEDKNTHDTPPLCPGITVALAPALRTIIFNTVAVGVHGEPGADNVSGGIGCLVTGWRGAVGAGNRLYGTQCEIQCAC